MAESGLMEESELTRLFEQALQLGGAERERFLAALTADQRGELEPLLLAEESAAGRGLFGQLIQSDRVQVQSGAMPKQIGRYKVLELIGEGGMGSVFLAEQTEPVKRKVALKIIKAGMDTAQVIARFEAERQAMAMMDHQHIAKVFDAGVTFDGLPYFVMELVKGMAITRYCDEAKLSTEARLRLLVQVCRAIQHAHQKGIIHRDIKPSNVLVTQADDVPLPKVIDFGLAKTLQPSELTDTTLFTNFGQVMGTLEYMSPEQAEMNSRDIDTRSDVYSLGVLLYELLTGSTPIGRERMRTEAYPQIMKLIREEEPQRPSRRLSDSGDAAIGISQQRATQPARLSALLNGDMDWIAMKALEKDRQRRYDGAAALADEIERFLKDEPIEARPPSFVYRLQKSYRRHRAPILTGLTLLLILIAGLISTGALWLRARSAEADAVTLAFAASAAKSQAEEETRKTQETLNVVQQERDRANAAQRETESALARSDYRLAFNSWREKLFDDAVMHMEKVPDEYRHIEWHLLRNQIKGGSINCLGHRGTVTGLAFSPDGNLLASAGNDKSVKLWDAFTGDLVETVVENRFAPCVAFTPDGSMLAFGTPTITLWDVENRKVVRQFVGHKGPVRCLEFNREGSLLVSGGTDSIRVWDVQSGQSKHKFPGAEAPLPRVVRVAFSPQEDTVVADGLWSLRSWDAITGAPLKIVQRGGTAGTVCFSPDGRDLAWVNMSRLHLATPDSGNIRSLKVPQSGPELVRFSPDGRLIVAACYDGRIRTWNRRSLAPTGVFGQLGETDTFAFSPDSRRIAISSGSRIQILAVDGAQEWHETQSRQWRLTSSCISPNGEFIAVCGFVRNTGKSSTGTTRITLWDSRLRRLSHTFAGSDRAIYGSTFSPDGQQIALASGTVLRIHDVQTGEVAELQMEDTTHQPVEDYASNCQFYHVAFSPNGDLLAAGGQDDRVVTVWSRRTGRILHRLPHEMVVDCLTFSPDSLRLAISSQVGLLVCDVRSGEVVSTMNHGFFASSVSFSPDGQRLVGRGRGRRLKVWNAAGDEVLSMEPHSATCNIVFASNGRRVVSAASDTVRISDAATGEELAELQHSRKLKNAFITADDESIFVVSEKGAIKEWSASRRPVFRRLQGHTTPIRHAAFNDDGSRIYSKGVTDRHVWDASTGEVLPDAKWIETDIGTSPDGRWQVAHAGKSVLLFDMEVQNHLETRTRQIAHAKPDPSWHDVQAQTAEREQDWFAATFHRAWQLKLNPASRTAWETLQAAHAKLSESQAPLPPYIAAEAMAITKPDDADE